MDRTGTGAGPREDRRNLGTHTAVIRAARQLVRRRGYNRVTIEAIAAEAGAGKQTIYRWWKTKAALFLEVYEGLVAEADLGTGKARLAVELRGLLLRLFRVHSAKPVRAILAGLLAEAPGDPAIAKAVSEVFVRRQRTILRPLLLLAQKRGEIRRAAEFNATADAISAALWFRLLLGQGPLNRRFAERLTAQLLSGIAAR
jgi:AcrR family transcriptional regulator